MVKADWGGVNKHLDYQKVMRFEFAWDFISRTSEMHKRIEKGGAQFNFFFDNGLREVSKEKYVQGSHNAKDDLFVGKKKGK